MVCFEVQEAKVTEAKINEARENYRPAAERASLLYFILSDLNKINPIYQFSLKVWLHPGPGPLGRGSQGLGTSPWGESVRAVPPAPYKPEPVRAAWSSLRGPPASSR